MKKIFSIFILMIMFINIIGLNNVYAAQRSNTQKIKTIKSDIPEYINDLCEVDISEFNPPQFQSIDGNWRYACYDFWGNYQITVITSNYSGPYYLAGEFYYDFYSNMFIPAGDNINDIALRIGLENNHLIIYGDVISDGLFNLPSMPAIVEGDSVVYLRRLLKPFVGGGGYYEFDVILPHVYGPDYMDIDDLYTLDFGHPSYLPGQNGEIFNLENLRCKVEYYMYLPGRLSTNSNSENSYYTHVELVDSGKELWIQGIYFYNAGYQAFYSYDCNGNFLGGVKFKYLKDKESFDITCGKFLGASSDYTYENGIYSLGINKISFVTRNIFYSASLNVLEGSPLVLVNAMTKKIK